MGNFSELLYKSSIDFSKCFLTSKSKNILFFDYCRAFEKYKFLANLGQFLYPYTMICIDGFKRNRKIDNYENIKIVESPQDFYFSQSHMVSSYGDIDFYLDAMNDITDLYYLHASYYNGNIDKNIIVDIVRDVFLYSIFTIKLYDPQMVIIWNMFHPLSQLAKKAADWCGKKVLWSEFGIFPNTICFEFSGQVGRSEIALQNQNMDKIIISEEELENAKHYLTILKSKLSIGRHNEDYYGLLKDKILEKAQHRPVIFFAGHNDLASGTYPYTQETKKYHSPIFKKSSECAQYIGDLCKKNDWFMLYKPHPVYANDNLCTNEYIYKTTTGNIRECIDISNVVCTVLSQTSYLSLISLKPVVMTGYNYLRGKNIAYEAYDKEKIDENIKNALSKGITNEQLTLWNVHAAQLMYHTNIFCLDETNIKWRNMNGPEEFAKFIKFSIEANSFTDIH